MLALEAGDVDVISRVPPPELKRLEAAAGIQLLKTVSIGAQQFRFNVTKKPLNDRRVRQAISYAIDRRAIVDQLVTGFATPSTGALTPIMRGYANLGEIPRDLDKARALLREAGYPNGFPLKIATTPRYPMGVELAEAVASQLKPIGIDASIQVFDWATMVQFWAGLPPEKNPQEMFIMGAGASTADADWGLRPIFRTAPTNENNYGYYSNAEFDRVIEAAMRETDEAQAAGAVQARAGDRLPGGSRRRVAVRQLLHRGGARRRGGRVTVAAGRGDIRAGGGPLILRTAGVALARVVPSLVGVSVLVFLIVHAIPGDPAVIAAGLEASPETVEQIRRNLGLDRPLPEQFVTFVTRALQGELGTSIRTGAPVTEEIVGRLPFTAILALCSVLVAAIVGVVAGVVAAVRHNGWVDHLVMSTTLLAVSTPGYWLGLMLMLTFSVWLGLLPAIGASTPRHFVLPVLTLGLQSAGEVARMTRATLLDVLGEEYLRAARARGVSWRRVLWRHALANTLVPITTILGLRFGGLLAGTVLVESVFAIPGMGRMMVEAVVARDFPMIQGGRAGGGHPLCRGERRHRCLGDGRQPETARDERYRRGALRAESGRGRGRRHPDRRDGGGDRRTMAGAARPAGRGSRAQLRRTVAGAPARYRPAGPRHAQPAAVRRPRLACSSAC